MEKSKPAHSLEYHEYEESATDQDVYNTFEVTYSPLFAKLRIYNLV